MDGADGHEKGGAKDARKLGAAAMRHRILTRLKLHHLRVVLEVARQESVSRAASTLNVAQPAVTKTLGEVETLLGTPLFERRPRGVVLNLFGETVLPHIEALFAELGRIGDDLVSVRDGLSGNVAVGGTMTVLPHLLPAILMQQAASAPGSVIKVVEGTIDQMIRALGRGEVDLVLGRVLGSAERHEFTQEILFDDPFVPVVGARHPLARVPAEDRDLSAYRWILPPEGSSAREPLELYMLRHGIRTPDQRIETVSYPVTMSLLGLSEMIAVLPRHLGLIGVRQGILTIVGPPIGEGRLPIGLTYRSDRPLHPLARALAQAFRDAVSALPHEEAAAP